jgi:hypothetical protein
VTDPAVAALDEPAAAAVAALVPGLEAAGAALSALQAASAMSAAEAVAATRADLNRFLGSMSGAFLGGRPDSLVSAGWCAGLSRRRMKAGR